MGGKTIGFSEALTAWRRGMLAIDGTISLRAGRSGPSALGRSPGTGLEGLRPDALLSAANADTVLEAVGAHDDAPSAALRGAALLSLGRGPAASDAFGRALEAGVAPADLDQFVVHLLGPASRTIGGPTAGIGDLLAMTAQSRSVVRIEDDSGAFFGSGVLVDGRTLADRLGAGPVVLTCAHVCCDAPGPLPKGWAQPLPPAAARAVFVDATRRDLPDGGRHARVPVSVTGVAWRSAVAEFDACALRVDPPPSWASPLPFTAHDPVPNRSRLYLTSYPGGGPVQFSLEDNRPTDVRGGFIEHDLAATKGSSGGPIFHRRDHGVVALHRGVREADGLAVWVGALRSLAAQPPPKG